MPGGSLHHGAQQFDSGARPLVVLQPGVPGAGIRARHGLLPQEQARGAVRQPRLRQRLRGAGGAVRLRTARTL